MLSDSFTLANGVHVPKIGLGTWQIPEGEAAYAAVRCALENGYRHIDTARAYGNERSVGRAVRDSGLPRDEVFVTSKLPAEIKTAEGAMRAFEGTMAALDLGHLDLYLVHAPWPWSDIGRDCREGNRIVWKVLEGLYRAAVAGPSACPTSTSPTSRPSPAPGRSSRTSTRSRSTSDTPRTPSRATARSAASWWRAIPLWPPARSSGTRSSPPWRASTA